MKQVNVLLSVIMALAMFFIIVNNAKAEGPIGVGPYVLAVSYTGSYDDLKYVANFANCDIAYEYYKQNCKGANVMSCLLEEYSALPSSYHEEFNYEPSDRQSCGFIGTDFTGGTND